MDFSNRIQSSQPRPAVPGDRNAPLTGAPKNEPKGGGKRREKLWRTGAAVLLVCIVVLAAAALLLLGLNNNNPESKYLQKNDYQAVFLNSGQVYFGHLKSVNGNYLDLEDIYYLQQQGSGNNAGVQLVKLGCELHAPYDRMVINDSQVTFWENLQPGGKVAQAIANYQKQYPNGKQCTDQSQASGAQGNVQNSSSQNTQQQSSSSNTQSQTSTTGNSNNSTTAPKQ